MLFYLFFGDLSVLEQITPGIYFSRTFSGILYSLLAYLKLCAFSLKVERVGFVLRWLQNASPFANPFFMPLVKSVDEPAIECNMNDFLRNCPYITKTGAWLTRIL